MYDAYGADTFRVYEMSMGPLDVSRPWETRAVVGSQRFLQRLWRLVVSESTGSATVVDEPVSTEVATAIAEARSTPALLTPLHLIRLALLDEHSALGEFIDAPLQEAAHAS